MIKFVQISTVYLQIATNTINSCHPEPKKSTAPIGKELGLKYYASMKLFLINPLNDLRSWFCSRGSENLERRTGRIFYVTIPATYYPVIF